MSSLRHAAVRHPLPYQQLVCALLKLSKTSKAQAVADKAVAAHPDSLLARGCWTDAMLAAGQPEQAFAALAPLPSEAEPLRYKAAIAARDARTCFRVPCAHVVRAPLTRRALDA